MTAYRVTLLDCDGCGEVLDLGGSAVGVTFKQLRLLATRYDWNRYQGMDLCSRCHYRAAELGQDLRKT